MVNCVKCGHELTEESLFCNKCGERVDSGGKSSSTIQRISKKAKWTILGGIAGVVVVVFTLIILLQNDPVKDFKSAIQGNKYSDATEIYETEISGDLEREKETEGFIETEIDTIKNDFFSDELKYDTALLKLETIEKTKILNSKVKSAKSEISKVNDSRIAFKTGQEFLSKSNYKDALEQFKKVVELDSNYAEAQELIENSSGEYKLVVLSDAETLVSQNNYAEAITLLSDALVIIPSDVDISAKKSLYQKELEEIEAKERLKSMEDAKANQIVLVEKTGIIVQSADYKALYPDMIQVVVKNNSDKTIKNMTVSILAYDSNKLPIKIERRFGNSSFEFLGYAENINVVSDAKFGENNGWEIDENHGISTVLAIVQEVEFYDGSKWANPYYEYWIEEYKEKPLK